jgi:hypothetical protein
MKTAILLKTLPVLGLTLVLSACGGGDDDPEQTGSITACFTANQTVNYAMATSGLPSGSVGANRSTVGPMTYNGQAVTGQTLFYPSGSTTYTATTYWTVKSNGVTFIANVNPYGVATPSSLFLPVNMSPGQTATGSNNTLYTFFQFETLILAGKTFPNTCHFKNTGEELWYAPGYGVIKQIESNGVISQYSGDR